MSGEKFEVTKLNISSPQTGIDAAQVVDAASKKTNLALFNTDLEFREYSHNEQQQPGVSNDAGQALFAQKLKTQQALPQTAQVQTWKLPTNSTPLSFTAIKNYLNRVKYGVAKFDEVIDSGTLDVLQKYGIPESEIKNMYDSNPRLQAIVYEMLQKGANYGILPA